MEEKILFEGRRLGDAPAEEQSLSTIETAFLRHWSTIDFSTHNEQEVREGFIINLLRVLGYRKGTSNDIEMEKSLRLSEPYHCIGRKRVSIDYAPSMRLRYFWILEAKPGNESPMQMRAEDFLQAHLYAIHPEVQARFIVLCNGHEVRVYDILVVEQIQCLKKFSQLREMLSAQTSLAFQRKRLLDLVGRTLDVEVDIEAFREFVTSVHHVLRDGEARVRENATALRQQHFQYWEQRERQEANADSNEVLFVKMDFPTNRSAAPVEEVARRIVEADDAGRRRLLDAIWQRCLGRPHNIFRGFAVGVLTRVVVAGVKIEPSATSPGLVETLERVVRANSDYWSSWPILHALCHLDNAAMRVAYKLCTRLAMNTMATLTKEARALLSRERRVAWDPTTANLMIPSIGHAQELLWRRWCSNNPQGVLGGLWSLQSVEDELDRLPVLHYPDGNSDCLFFAEQGRNGDLLRWATRNALNRSLETLRGAGLAEDVIEFGLKSYEELNRTCPAAPTAPKEFVSECCMKDLVEGPLRKVLEFRQSAALSDAMAID
jgi:hypothetical protein